MQPCIVVCHLHHLLYQQAVYHETSGVVVAVIVVGVVVIVVAIVVVVKLEFVVSFFLQKGILQSYDVTLSIVKS